MTSNERFPLAPAPILVPDAVLDDLRTRLRATRFADDTGNDDWYIGTLVTAQLGHKYANELYGIHIGTPVPLDMFNGDRAWDLTGGAQIPQDLPDDFRQQIKSWNKRFAAHVAVQVLDPSTLAAGLSERSESDRAHRGLGLDCCGHSASQAARCRSGEVVSSVLRDRRP